MPDQPERSRPSRLALWRALVGFVGVLLLVLGGSWLVVGRLIAPLMDDGWRTVGLLALLLTILPFIAFIAVRVRDVYPGAVLRLFVFRPFWYAQMFLLFGALVGGVGTVVGLFFRHGGDTGRAFLGVFAAAYVVVMTAGYFGSRMLRVRELDACFPDLPEGLDGVRIAQVSDLHVGPHSREEFMRRVATAVEAARADVIAVTGDLVDDFPADVDRYARLFGNFSAPLGVYAIPGNHDVYAGWPEVLERLRRLPLTVLVNDARVLTHRGARLAIVGTGDPAGGRSGDSATASPNIPVALAGVPEDAFVLALAHNPALWPALSQRGVALTLSGHTHWGQLAIPSRHWSLATPFLEHSIGSYVEGATALWINPGTSYWGIPFRLGAISEVTVVTLRRGRAVEIVERSLRAV